MRLGLACIACLALACGGDDSDSVVTGPSCDELCGAAASCTEPAATDPGCATLCGAQRKVYNQPAWSAYAECVTSSGCESLGDCTQQAIAATSEAPVERFIGEMCEWAVGCAGGAIGIGECKQMLRGLGDDDGDAGADDASPWDFVRLLRTSTVSCIGSCIRGLSCGETDFGSASADCAERCGLGELGAFGGDEDDEDDEESCEAQHGDCGEHGDIVENQYGGCECICEAEYVSLDWVCVPGCQQTGCGEHGECDQSYGICNCAEGYYATPGAETSGCTEMPYFVDLATGEDASCALRNDGAVECWGDMFDEALDLPDPNQGFVSLAMGGGPIGSSVCALRENGEVVCWGRVVQPDMQFSALSLDDDSGCGVRPDQSLYCWGFSPSGVTSPPPDPIGYSAVAIADRLACAIRLDRALECWGDADVLATMPAEGIADVEQVCARSGGACVRHGDGSIECFGFASYANMEVPEPNAGFVDVTCGEFHACALREAGTPVCWGVSALVGTLEPTEDPPSVFTDLEAGRDHSCGLREDGSIGCWGRSTYNEAPADRRASLR